MPKRLIVPPALLRIMLRRLCHQLIETHGDFKDTVLIGLQPRGSYLAKQIHRHLQEITGKEIQLGLLDITFYRDDFRRREIPLTASETTINFPIENRNVVLIDDVLFTGRSVRAANDAMTAFGRPQRVELLVLIDRRYSRELPVAATYVGKYVNSLASEKVKVLWEQEGNPEDAVWLISKNGEE